MTGAGVLRQLPLTRSCERDPVRVVLVNPPQRYFKQSQDFSVYFPLGLLYIAAMIKDVCDVKILDCLVADFKIKKSKDWILYGTPQEKIRTIIQRLNPDIVGITVPFSAQSGNAIAVSAICKEINPNIVVVLGGPDASVRHKYFLENGFCDFCVVGEGERTFFEFVNNFASKRPLTDIDGLAYKARDGVHYKPREFIRDLDDIPLPAYDLVDVNKYLRNPYLYVNRSPFRKNSISVITSRGCPYGCVFCSIKLHMGRGYRYHSPDYVIRHLKFLMREYGITSFHFEDDNISLNKGRFDEILSRIIQKRLVLQWDTPNGVRADTLDEESLKKIRKSGCQLLTIAIESGNQRVLDEVIKKSASLDYMLHIVRCCKRIGLALSAFYVIGFPGETVQDMRETVNLALRLFESYSVIPYVFVATPLYGTELYERSVQEGLIQPDLTDAELSTATQCYGKPLIATEEFTKDAVREIMRDYERKMKKIAKRGTVFSTKCWVGAVLRRLKLLWWKLRLD